MRHSPGGRVVAWLGLRPPARLRSATLGRIGIAMIEGGGPGENVAAALEAPSLEDVTDPVGRTFRAFADQTRSDRRAPPAPPRGFPPRPGPGGAPPAVGAPPLPGGTPRAKPAARPAPPAGQPRPP